jgi:uncharacterized protein (TIGR00730 family)
VKNICVFCGSSFGKKKEYKEKAGNLGKEIANRGYGLVYGGGAVGIMGALAKSCLDTGGAVCGIIPRRLYEMVDHFELTEIEIVETMHKRKEIMYKKADGFIVFPGGIGTLEEFFECWTWNQIGYHNKNIVLYNVGGYFNTLLKFLEEMEGEQFILSAHRSRLKVAPPECSEKDLLDLLEL